MKGKMVSMSQLVDEGLAYGGNADKVNGITWITG